MRKYILSILFSILLVFPPFIQAASPKINMDAIDTLNYTINRIPYKSDPDRWGQNDYWATPLEFYVGDGGDCEDYAIAKYFALIEQGIPYQNLLLTAGELDSGGLHMVLLLTTDQPYVLDSMHNHVIPLSEFTEFTIMYSFNESVLIINDDTYDVKLLTKWQNLLSKMNYKNF